MSSDDIPVFHLKPSLIDLVKRGESAPVIHYLKKYPEEINTPDEDGFFPIHHAIQEKQSDIITILIEFGADIQQKAPQNVSSLMLASLHGMAGSLPLAQCDKQERFQTDEGGNSICHYLAFNGDVVQWNLFEIPDAEIVRPNLSGKSALQVIIEEGKIELFSQVTGSELVQKEIESNIQKFINRCIRGNHGQLLELLLPYDELSENHWNDLIEQCCVLEKSKCLERILKWGDGQKMQIDTHRLKAVPSGLITLEIRTILDSYL